MAPRLELQSLLEGVTDHVYFQPPANVQMEYPCIIYSRDGTSADHANNETVSTRQAVPDYGR
jgi:hypothetical protein